MSIKKWVVSKYNKTLASEAAGDIGVDPVSTLIATSRGIDTLEELSAFFDIGAHLELSPFSIKDMDKAVERINRAIDSFEPICVYGDYDCDGVTSTALLYSYLDAREANVIRYIPERIKEGYGMNNAALDKLKALGTKLIITVDNGITAVKQIEYAYSLGMDVVVTDHHKPDGDIPVCEAVVDPHRADCQSRFKHMSGVGVAFKLICALEGDNDGMLLDEFGDLIAIGTIADVVSLTGENRTMVRRGLKIINSNPRPGIKALIDAAGTGSKYLSSTDVAFLLCPRINAAGRMGNAETALELLLSTDEEEAGSIATEICSMNTARQSIENTIFLEAVSKISGDESIIRCPVIVVSGEGWHQGVIGIVAAKITEFYGKPSVVISCDGEDAKGSCRSVEGFSIFDALSYSREYVDHFGGHTLAAGVSLKTSDINLFRKKINEFALKETVPFQTQIIDLKINPASVNLDLVDAVEALEPFGAGNPQPVFGIFGARIEAIYPLSEGKHTRIVVSKNGSRLSCLCFRMSTASFEYSVGDYVDIACVIKKDIFNGEQVVSVIAKGFRFSKLNEDSLLSSVLLYNRFSYGQPLTRDEALAILPDRGTQVDVYKSVKFSPVHSDSAQAICIRLNNDGSGYAKIRFTADVMKETGIFLSDDDNTLSVNEKSAKVDLEQSSLFKKLRSFL
ncbi:MAG: single-stranded-DNA-specific exonuclease RecJ [Clostridiales bacterium]|nr:single-stranded-DNA-specific exonuclease RecJ [Clostridiales bacterium]